MKKTYFTLTLFLIFLAINSYGQTHELTPGGEWLTSFETAMKKSKNENKPVLISFAGSDWCKPCIKLTKEVFETERFKAFAGDNLVLLLLDFPRLKKNEISKHQTAHNERLAAIYNREGAFPTVVLIDPEEKVLGKTGYIQGGPVSYIHYLESILNN